MREILLKQDCTGCGACMQKCPTNAISMKPDKEGFLFPNIDKSKCKNCNICNKVCPKNTPLYINTPNPLCYIAMANDELRKNSSSGAIFPVLALKILKADGYVCGAAFADNGSVEHIIINKIEDLPKLQGSKYLQSDTKQVFCQLKQLLDTGNNCLFVGTPCQVAGLQAFLNQNYNNLITVDILCHGVPSPKVFAKYLSEISTDGGKFISTNFRDKTYGWSPKLNIVTTTTTNTISNFATEDNFMKAFLNNLSLRKSCATCRFNKLPRQGDITIGDFWGVDYINKNWNDKKGISEVLVNNEKGNKFWTEIQKDLKFYTSIELKSLIAGNPNLIKATNLHGNRDYFFNNIDNMPLKNVVENSLKYDYLCLNFWTSLNYGAVLTAYATQSILDSFGLRNAHIDYRYKHVRDTYDNSFTDKFARKYLHTTNQCIKYKDFCKLNKIVEKGFIVGSDQVFRDDYIKKTYDFYLLGFAEPNKQRLALSASFGKNSFKYKLLKFFFKAFDSISVREMNGIKICKTLGVKATHILDPVFLANPEIYYELIKNTTVPKGKVVGYILDKKEEYNKLIEPYGNNFINIANKNISVEEFLAYIANAESVITDSFHGTCFALIFNKPFLTLSNQNRGNSRFDSLFATFKISNNNLNGNIDWSCINKTIEKEREKGILYLSNCITLKPEHTKRKKLLNCYFLLKGAVRKFLCK